LSTKAARFATIWTYLAHPIQPDLSNDDASSLADSGWFEKGRLLDQPAGRLSAFQLASSIMADETVTRGEAGTVPYQPSIEHELAQFASPEQRSGALTAPVVLRSANIRQFDG